MSVTLEIVDGPNPETDEDGWENNAYIIRLKYQGRRYTTEWHQGLGITKDPDAASVLETLLSTAQGVEGIPFEEWAADYGYDPDSRKAERIYNAVRREAKNVRRLLGADYDRLGEYDNYEAAAKALA